MGNGERAIPSPGRSSVRRSELWKKQPGKGKNDLRQKDGSTQDGRKDGPGEGTDQGRNDSNA